MRCEDLVGSLVPQTRVEPALIIEQFDPPGNRCSRRFAGGILGSVHELDFQCSVRRFGQRVVIATSGTPYRLTKVEFFQGTTKLGEAAGSPYSITVAAGLPAGSYALTARATDNSGLQTTSEIVNIATLTFGSSGGRATMKFAPK